MFKTIKKIFLILIIMIIIMVGAIAGMYLKDNKGKCDPLNSDNIIIEIEQGESVVSVAQKLKSEGVIRYPKLFTIHGSVFKRNSGIKFGLHPVKKGMTYEEIYNSISKSEMSLDVYNKVTIPEGFTVQQIAKKLSQENVVNEESFLELAKEGNFDFWFLRGISVDGGKYKLEGFMYPQTYYFKKNATEKEIIEEFLKEFEKNVSEYEDKYSSQEFYDILKIASIIEKETFIDKEKDIVSGVFYNRINNGVRLESCATVEYVLNTGKKVLSYDDISIDSPYNTYRVNGLPPTPISNPSITSIKAAENPTDTEYMFFVANKDGNGHVFSKTYDEHLKNIEKYR